MHLRVVTDARSDDAPAPFRPDHRSPRWLGLLSLVLSALTVLQIAACFESLRHLLA